VTFGVVIVTWNGERYIEACVRSVLGQQVMPVFVVVVDNASDDRTVDLVSGFESRASARGSAFAVVRESTNTGFTRGANTGLRQFLAQEGRVDVVVLLNQDAEIDPRWCAAVGKVFEADVRVGAVGARILRPDRVTIQHAGGYLERPRLVGRHFGDGHADVPGAFDVLHDVEFVTAAAMAIRTDALREVGCFDEVFSPGYYEDVDLCTRLRDSGWRVVYAPLAVAIHVESASFSSRMDRLSLSHRNRLIYALPWLVDPLFRAEVCLAERRAFTLDSPIEERRALALAYLSTVLLMPEAMKARVPSVIVTAALAAELIGMFGQLREEALAAGLRWHATGPAGLLFR
jgi:GT2 family glycosyltransferase